MTVDIDIKGLAKIQQALDKLDPKKQRTTVQKAVSEANKKVLAPRVKAATPWSSMRRAVRARQGRRGRPAAIVLYDAKKAWFRHFLLGGTKPHAIRFPDQKRAGVPKEQGNIHHPGIEANPVIGHVADQYGDDALDYAAKWLSREMGLEE